MEVSEFLKIVRKGDIDTLNELEASGFDITVSNKQGVNGFFAAVKARKMKVAEWFWARGVSSVYASTWEILACDEYLDYYIKFDGHRHLTNDQLTRAIMSLEYNLVIWGIKESKLSNGQKQACFAHALRYCSHGNYLGDEYDLLPLKMVKLCMELLPDITENDNLIMIETFNIKDKLQPEVVEFIMNNEILIDTAIKLEQYKLLPEECTNIFFHNMK